MYVKQLYNNTNTPYTHTLSLYGTLVSADKLLLCAQSQNHLALKQVETSVALQIPVAPRQEVMAKSAGEEKTGSVIADCD